MNITPSPVSTSPCRLRLYPLDQVLRFAVIDGVAHLTLVGEPYIPNVVPGTLAIGDQPSGNLHVKNHSFRMRSKSSTDIRWLEQLTNGYFIALYFDERGIERVSGTPSYPLTAAYSRQEGQWLCQLTGTSTLPDVEMAAAVSQ